MTLLSPICTMKCPSCFMGLLEGILESPHQIYVRCAQPGTCMQGAWAHPGRLSSLASVGLSQVAQQGAAHLGARVDAG